MEVWAPHSADISGHGAMVLPMVSGWNRKEGRRFLSCWFAPFLFFWPDRFLGDYFVCAHWCSGLVASPESRLSYVRQNENPGNSLPCCSSTPCSLNLQRRDCCGKELAYSGLLLRTSPFSQPWILHSLNLRAQLWHFHCFPLNFSLIRIERSKASVQTVILVASRGAVDLWGVTWDDRKGSSGLPPCSDIISLKKNKRATGFSFCFWIWSLPTPFQVQYVLCSLLLSSYFFKYSPPERSWQ